MGGIGDENSDGFVETKTAAVEKGLIAVLLKIAKMLGCGVIGGVMEG